MAGQNMHTLVSGHTVSTLTDAIVAERVVVYCVPFGTECECVWVVDSTARSRVYVGHFEWWKSKGNELLRLINDHIEPVL